MNLLADTAGVTVVPAVLIPDVTFVPAAHMNYQETVLPMKDILPKFRDFPKEAGGSGGIIPK